MGGPGYLNPMCAVCGATRKTGDGFSVPLPIRDRTRLGFDIAVTCGSAYCIDRAERGAL